MYKHLTDEELFKRYRECKKRWDEDPDAIAPQEEIELNNEVVSRSRKMSEKQYFELLFGA